MRLLLITYSFPPAAGVGVLRALSLAKYLPQNGIHVEVLTARNAAAVGRDYDLEKQISEAVRIHRTWTPDLPFYLRKAIKKVISGGTRPSPASRNTSRTRVNPIKVLLGNLLLPDPQVGWLPFALRAARRIVAANKVDVVLVTVPPFSSVRLVTSLRRYFPNLPIVLDFRDEWLTTTINLVSFNNNARAKEVASKAEREAVRDATLIVCVTNAAVSELRNRYPESESKFQCIPNGYEPRQVGSVASTPLDLNIAHPQVAVLTYIGSVYGSTDPTPVVEAFLTLPFEIRDALHFRFIGHIETPMLRQVLERLGANVDLIGFLPQAKALQFMETTTYLLLITHDPINIAAKLYDYLSSGRPILAAVHASGDVRSVLDASQTGWSADIEDIDALRRMLIEAVERLPHLLASFHPNQEEVAKYSRVTQAARYADTLHTLFRSHKG